MNFESFVLAASTADLEAAMGETVREHADAVEFRLDLADDPFSALDAYDGDCPVIATNRVEWEGGDAPDNERRVDALERAVEYECVEAVDVELEAIRRGDIDERLDELGSAASLIVSVHDFDRTPSEADCRSLLDAALDHGDIGKLAVTATGPDDVLTLLSATHDLSIRGAPVATMAMGEAGRHSRAIAPLYGSRIGYAPIDPTEATAPGQYDLATLANLIDHLGGPER